MKQIDPKESDALLVYHRYWNSYSDGDLEVFASTLDEGFEMIGTSESEICHSKSDGIAFFKFQMHEMVGRTEMRNRDIAVKSVNGMFLVNESCDVYILVEANWTFYSRLRLSTLLHETESGWKVIQQHGSLPDMRVQEGETIAFDKISKENLELRDAVRRRTAELENKNRELAIEAALEKVRAVAMGMKKPKDMLDVCWMIAAQLEEFGVTKIRNVQTAIIDEKIGQYLCYQYFPAYGQTTIEDTEYHKSPVEHGMVKQMLSSRDGHFTGTLSGKELEEFGLHRKEENHFPDPLLDVATELSYCFLSIGEGGLGLSLYQAMETEVLVLFKRFHQVFSLAYQRFRDIQKAEAQAREAQIEAALERIRSRALAMHTSNEIFEVAFVLREQMGLLGQPELEASVVHLYDTTNGIGESWHAFRPANEGFGEITQGQFQFLKDECALTKEFFELYESGQKEYTIPAQGEQLRDWVLLLIEKSPDIKKSWGGVIPAIGYHHFSTFSGGALLSVTREEVSEEGRYLQRRAASVFDLAYKRYLDLQKAEAQAREAQIETALERVRSRTMAMNNSQELKEVALELRKQMGILGQKDLEVCAIHLYDEDDSFESWSAMKAPESNAEIVQTQARFSKKGLRIVDELLHHYEKGTKDYVLVNEGEKTVEWFEAMKKHAPQLYASIMNSIGKLPLQKLKANWSVSDFLGGALVMVTYGEPDASARNLLRRSANVFEQAYVRFLDLQKAEAQAREAQIQLALERVRARTMAMQKSEELAEVSYLLNKQVVELGIPTRGCAFNIYNEHDSTEWFSNLDGTLPAYKTPRENIFLKYYEAGQRGETLLVEEFGKERIKQHYDYLHSLHLLGHDDEVVEKIRNGMPDFQIDHVAYFKYGYLLFITLVHAPGAHDVFRRFAKEFEQTYTRFLDLQKAEAQAREAQIEVSLEKVRSTSLAMHKAEELKNVVSVVFQKLKELGLTFDVAGIQLYAEGLKDIVQWVAAPDLLATPVLAYLPFVEEDYLESEIIKDYWSAKETGISLFNKNYSFEEKNKFFEYAGRYNDFIAMPEDVREFQLKAPVYTQSLVAEKRSALWVDSYSGQTITSEAIDILKRFSRVFEQAYVRFLDLQKAEAQAREAQIEASLERVRSTSLAMHTSQDLSKVVYVVFTELIKLDAQLDRSLILTVNPETLGITWYLTGKEGLLSNNGFLVENNPHPSHQAYLEGWRTKRKKWHYLLEGEEKKSCDEYLFSQTELAQLPDFIKADMAAVASIHTTISSDDFGCLIASSISPLPEAYAVIVDRFTSVFNQTYTRFLDLQKAEAQAKDAQIELALERVRAKTMAIQKPAEFLDVISVIGEQLANLGFDNEWVNFGANGLDVSKGIEIWELVIMPGQYQSAQRVFIPYTEHILFRTLIEQFERYKKDGTNFFTLLLDKKELGKWLDHQYKETVYKEMPAEVKALGYSKTSAVSSYIILKDTWFEVGKFSTHHFTDEENEIFKRFANAFGQAYTRFLDLQKAEAQARESQIQLALERVRARTMAMQKSDELPEAANLLFQQVQSLGMPAWSAGYCTWKEDLPTEKERKSAVTLWMSSEGVLQPPFIAPTTEDKLFIQMRQGAEKGKDLHVVEMGGEELEQHYRYMRELPVVGKILDSIIEVGHPLPTFQIMHQAYFSKGFLLFITYEPVPESHEIFKRFAKVFDQTYTRFLDLQKAEAQAREAQIEAALERVRSRSMGMQRGEDLKGVVKELYNQLRLLGFQFGVASIIIMDADTGDLDWWMEGIEDGYDLPEKYHVPYFDHPGHRQQIYHWKNGSDYAVIEISGSEKKAYDAYYFYQTDFVKAPESSKNLMMSQESVTFSMAYMKYGSLSWSPSKLDENQAVVLQRMAIVFEQTYTRFLDLQKAEAQAREAQIEAALEKIRSRSLAMHNSGELEDVIAVLFEKLKGLGLSFDAASIQMFKNGSKDSVSWVANPDVISKPLLIQHPYDEKYLHKSQLFFELWEARKTSKDVLNMRYSFEEKNKYFEYVIKYNPQLPPEVGKRMREAPSYTHSLAVEKNAILIVDSWVDSQISQEDFLVVKRFAKVFDQTFTRFLDLQKAEAQAREAQVEAALERLRSKTMAMHNSKDVGESVATLFDELSALGVLSSHDRCGIGIMQPHEMMEVWTAEKSTGKTELTIGYLDMRPHALLRNVYQSWLDRKETFHYTLEGEDKQLYAESIVNQPRYKIRKDYFSSLEVIEHTDFFFEEGCLYIFSVQPISNESAAVFSRFVKVFGQTYRRYLDLQKAEKQAREAQIEAALEKVRSRSLAMQSPDELIEVARLLREEMGALGVEELETSSIYIQDESSGLTQCWFTIKNPDNPDKAITDQMTLDLQDTWVGQKMDEFYRSKAKQTSILMQGEERIEWIRYCEEKSDLFGTSNFYGETIPDRIYHLYKFSNGYIGAAAPGEISKESWDLLKRATTVFSFAYTRFRDIQMAQSSARAAMRQASLDRVRADISSMRNAEDLDRITPLIFKELTVLGVPFIRCGVFIIQEKQKIVEAYLSSPEGNSLGVLRLPYQASELTYQTVEAWRKGAVYRQHWNKEDFIQWINQLMELDQIQDSNTYQGSAAPPESLDLHFVPFTQGMIYVGAVYPLDDKDLELVQVLAKAFSIAYARFEDFVKLEQAKAEIESAMSELKATQSQLVQQEKLASLGQLTAGIAHEIKNPLNFVNNFSEVSIEMMEEALEEMEKREDRDETLIREILEDIRSNIKKVHEHGSRANGIVTSMLQHSRGGTGKKEPTDLNALIKEYVNLSFHGMRAGKNPINVDIILDLDPDIKEVSLIKEDFTRVIINLCNNAFDAMRTVTTLHAASLRVRTKKQGDKITIEVEDNGPGIPDDIKDKILQPFFTTKKGTEGTGLGLSITHDIVKAHGGELRVESQEGMGTVFSIHLPKN